MTDPYRMILINGVLSVLLLLLIVIYRYIYPKRNINLFTLLILISILPVISIFRPGTYESGDVTIHTVFLQSFYENLKDGVLIPRWAGGLCGGYGCPVYIIQYTFPYYFGSLFHILGFSFLNSLKLVLAFSFILSGITMYIFLKDEYGNKLAFVGSLLYMFAPMHLMELHFRASVGSVVGFIFIPLAFLFIKKSLTKKPIFIVLFAINFLFLILSHAATAFIVFIASFFYAFIKKRSTKDMLFPLAAAVLGIGLSAFYLLPAYFEGQYTWSNPMVFKVTDFKPFLEYIFSPAGFGFLYQGSHGELRLVIGYAHLLLVIIGIYYLFKNKFTKPDKKTVLYLLSIFALCFLFLQSFTEVIWNNVSLLKVFQFPWRILDIVAFITAFLGTVIIKKWRKQSLIILCIFVVFSTILNWGNRKMVPFNPNEYYKHWSIYIEYFDPNNPTSLKWYKEHVSEIPNLILHRPTNHLEILSGDAELKEIGRSQVKHEYLIHAKTDLQLVENTHYFLGWTVLDNGKPIPINFQSPKKYNTITFELPEGLHNVEVIFEDTLIRTTSERISLISLLILIILSGKIILRKLFI